MSKKKRIRTIVIMLIVVVILAVISLMLPAPLLIPSTGSCAWRHPSPK